VLVWFGCESVSDGELRFSIENFLLSYSVLVFVTFEERYGRVI
jgi:hypothetical protein